MPATTLERRRRRLPHWHPPPARPTGNLGLIDGAANDDPVAIGTYASAGARLGPIILWAAPAVLPMMFAVVYLSTKLGQVAGQGLAAVMRRHYPRWLLLVLAAGLLLGNTVEAAADLGGLAAALNLLVPRVAVAVWALPLGAAIFLLQFFGSYVWIRSIFRWLALALLAYVGSAVLARPSLLATLRATFLPHVHLTRGFFAVLVAMIGTSLSPYMYVWQAGQQVEEDVSMGRRRLSDRRGTSAAKLEHTARDMVGGMAFACVVMYFILLATSSTLYPHFPAGLTSATDAARALAPLAGSAAGICFALGVIGVGFLAVPVMSVGAGYVVCDVFGWKSGLAAKPREARAFYAVIGAVTAAAVAFNWIGFNPIRALFYAGIVQGLLAPVLMVVLLQLTNSPGVMGQWTNSRGMNLLGWATAALAAAAVIGMLALG